MSEFPVFNLGEEGMNPKIGVASTNGPGRFLPDRALDVLDDAATLASAEVR